jgi:hypothetical protein
MLRLDFYRLFHTPAFFVMLAVSAIIPAMLLTMTGGEPARPDLSVVQSAVTIPAALPTAAGGEMTRPDVSVVQSTIEYTNTWQLIESSGGSAVADNPMDFGGYANINMVFIFAGLLMAIFVAHDYISGFVKNIFTVHSKKMDYVVSKSAVGIFGGIGMIAAYVFGAVIAGIIVGKSFDVNFGGLLMCLVSKMFLMGVFCPLFLSIAVFFRNRLWLTIVFTFLLGMMFYPAASVATLNSTVITALISLTAGVIGTVAFGTGSTLILKRRDLA